MEQVQRKKELPVKLNILSLTFNLEYFKAYV